MNIENNKIIAEFMGNLTNENNIVVWKNAPKYINELTRLEDAKYHTDWNWLMEIVEKIYQTDLYYDKYIDFNSSMFSSGKIELSTKISSVYNGCVEFIKWYNEQNK